MSGWTDDCYPTPNALTADLRRLRRGLAALPTARIDEDALFGGDGSGGGDGSNGGVPDERWADDPLLTVAFTAFTAVAVVLVLAAEARDRARRVARMIRLIARPR